MKPCRSSLVKPAVFVFVFGLARSETILYKRDYGSFFSIIFMATTYKYKKVKMLSHVKPTMSNTTFKSCCSLFVSLTNAIWKCYSKFILEFKINVALKKV